MLTPDEPLTPGERPGAGSPDPGGVAGPGGAPDCWPSGASSRVGGLVPLGWLPRGRLPGAGGLVRGGSGFRLPGLAQPWARGCPSASVTVTHHFVAGCPAAWVARSRARAASMGPNPVASPGWSARPSRVASGMVRLIFAAGRIGAAGGPSGPVPLGCSGAALSPGSVGRCADLTRPVAVTRTGAVGMRPSPLRAPGCRYAARRRHAHRGCRYAAVAVTRPGLSLLGPVIAGAGWRWSGSGRRCPGRGGRPGRRGPAGRPCCRVPRPL